MPLPSGGPYLQLACLCENVIEDKAGVLSLIRIIDRIQIDAHGPEAPVSMPEGKVSLKLVLSFKSGSARGSIPVTIQPIAPSGLKSLPALKMDVFFEGEDRGANLVTNLQLPVKEQGLNWFDVSLEDQLITRIPLRIVYRRFTQTQTKS